MKKLLLTAFVFLSIILFSCKKNETHQTNSPVQYLPTSNPEGRNQEGTILLGISKRFVQQNTYGIEWTTIRYIPNTSFVSSYTDSFSALPANGYPGSKSFYYTYSYDNAFNLLGILDANDTIKIISNNLGQVQKLYGGTGFESYHYNDASQIINDSTFIYPNNNLDGYVNYSYDNIGNLVQASVWNNSVDSTIFQNEADVYFSYDNQAVYRVLIPSGTVIILLAIRNSQSMVHLEIPHAIIIIRFRKTKSIQQFKHSLFNRPAFLGREIVYLSLYLNTTFL